MRDPIRRLEARSYPAFFMKESPYLLFSHLKKKVRKEKRLDKNTILLAVSYIMSLEHILYNLAIQGLNYVNATGISKMIKVRKIH